MQDHKAFINWIEGSLPTHIDAEQSLQLQPLTGDAGFRRYFRVNHAYSDSG